MATSGPLQRLLEDSDEEENDFFDPEQGLFSATEANRPILDFTFESLNLSIPIFARSK